MENIQDFNSFINSQSHVTENTLTKGDTIPQYDNFELQAKKDKLKTKYDLTHEQVYRFLRIGTWIDDEGFATPMRIAGDPNLKKLEDKGLLKIDGKKVLFTDLGRIEYENISVY